MNDQKETSTNRQTELPRFAGHKRVTRREFMQVAAALGITASAATSLWSERAEAAPKRGGHLRVGTEGGSNTDSLDPRRAIGNNHATTIIHSMFDPLVNLDAGGNPIPAVAESWESSDDLLTWRFKIRKDVEFHNGKTLDVDDIIHTYAYLDNDANTHGDGRNIMGSIAERKKDGAATGCLVGDIEELGAVEIALVVPVVIGIALDLGSNPGIEINQGVGAGPDTFVPLLTLGAGRSDHQAVGCQMHRQIGVRCFQHQDQIVT